jgi:hypothetical protein
MHHHQNAYRSIGLLLVDIANGVAGYFFIGNDEYSRENYILQRTLEIKVF